MYPLIKKRYGNRGGGNKYYIDCSRYAENSNNIKIQHLLRNTKETDVAILKAVATDEIIQKKNKHIVVKIGSQQEKNKGKEDMSQKEYRIGKVLFDNKLKGFIKYICLFECFDNTSKNLQRLTPNNKPIQTNTNICNAPKTDTNKKNVLVMPYINNGSIENYHWTTENIDLLKNLIIHTIFSLATAFEKVGFVHRDLHLGNVLFKKTEIKHINYNFENKGAIPLITLGYKVVIMDFEKSLLGQNRTEIFWSDLLIFFTKLKCMENENNELINWNNEEIISFTNRMLHEKQSVENVVDIIECIEKSQFDFINIKPEVYNPNVF